MPTKTSRPGTPGLIASIASSSAGLHEHLVVDELLRRLADDEGARHVGEAAGLAVARPDVDDDRLTLGDPPVTPFVADRALRAVRDDGLVGDHVVLGEDLADPTLEPLGGERPALERQPAPFGFASRSISRTASIAASAARWARRMPSSSVLVLTRRRCEKSSRSAVRVDSFLAEDVSELEREIARNDGARHADQPAGVEGELEVDVLPVDAGGDHSS